MHQVVRYGMILDLGLKAAGWQMIAIPISRRAKARDWRGFGNFQNIYNGFDHLGIVRWRCIVETYEGNPPFA